MKIKSILVGSLLASVLMLTSCGETSSAGSGTSAANSNTSSATSANPLAGTYDLKLWVSETAGVSDLTATQIDDFEAANPGIVINQTIEGVSESTSATQMLTDIDAGADLYCFAQDQFARLVQGGALTKLGVGASATVTADNDAGSVAAVKSGSDLYAYPLTSDNGYFLYYDSSVLSASDVTNMTTLLAKAKDAGKNVSFEMGTSAWYLASYFFGTDCHSTWTTDNDGKFTDVNDDFKSANGLVAIKGIQELVKATNYVSSSSAADFIAATPSCAVVTGTWAYNDVKTNLGEHLACAKLPEFTVGGVDYQLGSFSGNKLMGVKPHADAKTAAVCSKLALYLTGARCQEERFDAVAWGPSNKAVQALSKVTANEALAALAQQNAFATPQGQIHGSWWDIAKVIGTAAANADMGDEVALNAALTAYDDAIHALFTAVDNWGVVGSMAASNWSTNINFTNENDGSWTLDLALAVDDMFKVRNNADWDTFKQLTLTLPAGLTQPSGFGENIVCGTAGTYHFVINSGATTLVITLNS